MNKPVDIVIPVYRNQAITQRCIESVLSSTATLSAVTVLVIDDASPEPELSAYLRTLAEQGKVELLVNSENLGFVATVNRAFAHTQGDVLLLNSDTEVAPGWLSRIQQCAYQQPQVGTVTPFSNNATICSYPGFNKDNPLPPGWTLAQLDQIFATVNEGQSAPIPTGVGFCMYVRRACLDQVGFFDEEHFGRGYGEESDFCMRAKAQGWHNLIAADTFVYHHGGVSFCAETRERIVHAENMMNTLHPQYRFEVARFISADPLREFRDRVDDVRVQHSLEDATLVVSQVRDYRDRIIQSVLEYKDFIDVEREQYKTLLADTRAEFTRTDQGLANAEALVEKYILALDGRDKTIEQLGEQLSSAQADFKRTDEGLFEAQRIVREYQDALAQRDRALEVAHQQIETFVRNNQSSVHQLKLLNKNLRGAVFRLLKKLTGAS